MLVKNADSNPDLESENLWEWGHVICILNCSQLHPRSTKLFEVLPDPLAQFSFQKQIINLNFTIWVMLNEACFQLG